MSINFTDSISWIINVITGREIANEIVKLRSIWFLAQIATHKKTFKGNDLQNQIFTELATIYCLERAATADGFVAQYLVMQALVAYFKGCTLL